MSFEKEAKEKWGGTAAYAEYAEKAKSYSAERFADINSGLENIFREFSEIMESGASPVSDEALRLTEKLRKYITDYYFTCTPEILAGLGQMYTADERFKNSIDRHAPGTAEFVSRAIAAFAA